MEKGLTINTPKLYLPHILHELLDHANAHDHLIRQNVTFMKEIIPGYAIVQSSLAPKDNQAYAVISLGKSAVPLHSLLEDVYMNMIVDLGSGKSDIEIFHWAVVS